MFFDFKKYHVRSMNASSEHEKEAVNQELKFIYESLSDERKKDFNEQLQAFLIEQYKTISHDYEALKEGGVLGEN